MKTIIIFLLAVMVVLSQNGEPSTRTFTWNTINGSITDTLNTNNDYFKLNSFIIGWMWGGERKISQVMKVNQADTEPGNPIYLDANRYNDNTNLFIRAKHNSNNFYTHCKEDNSVVHTKSLLYSVVLKIDTVDNYKLVKLPNDPENHVFGFKTKSSTCIDSQFTDDNKWRLIVNDSVPENTVILQDPMPNNLLHFHQTNEADGRDTSFTGRAYYLSINLRRLDNNDGYGSDTVLILEVPYLYNNKTTLLPGIATFSKLPKDSINAFLDKSVLNYQYGNLWATQDESSTKMVITKNMLPMITDSSKGDITISGYIDFNGIDIAPYKNHRLKEHSLYADSLQIDKLNLKVTYKGGCKIAIGWLKYESPNTRKLVNGVYDDIIYNGIQANFNAFTDNSFSSRNINLKRLTINVEGSPINWAVERHISKLLGDIITGSNGISLPLHYDYYINSADKWISFSNIHSYISNPFNGYNDFNYQTGTNEWKTSGLASGYKIKAMSKTPANLFESEWETYLRYDNTKTTSRLVEEMRGAPLDVYTDSEKLSYAGGPMSIQAYWEHKQYTRLVDKFMTGFQYSDKPWFAQSFVENFVYKAPVDTVHVSYSIVTPDGFRIITPEEFKLMNWNALILGAKGLIYDGDADAVESMDSTFNPPKPTNNPNLRLLPSESVLMNRMNIDWATLLSMDDDEFINHPQSTSDFLDHTYDHLNLYNGNHNLDIVAATMDVPKNRIFVGKRSIRREMKRLHNWVRTNESTLMDLRLQAWYGKGYKIWYNQHPKWDTSSKKIQEFINVDSIKTVKLYKVDSTGYTNEKVVESTYESFLDLTLLANKNDENMTETFYVGVQNRRTDPFVYTKDTLNMTYFDEEGSFTKLQYIYSDMKFYTTAEFEKNCLDSGKVIKPDTLFDEYGGYYAYYDTIRPPWYWRDLYWKRLGCREISIPFKIGDSSYKKLRVIELTDTSDIFKKPPYYTAIDTVIPKNGSISVRFLPGEGKFFKVSNFEEDEVPFKGELAFSNQHKLVVYPTRQTSNIDFNGKDTMVYYHAVYHKRDSLTNKNSVYYRRSLPYNASGFDQIHWEQGEKLISRNLVIKQEIEPNLNVDSLIVDTCNCKYPSIVVRYDAIDSTQKAYIVYNCAPIQLSDTPKVYVVESVIDCDEPYQAIMPAQLIYPIGFAYANQGNEFAMNTWGVPVVNASADGQFYTWADSIYGIVAGYKTPNDKGYMSNKIFIKYYNTPNTNSIQPSLNIYSRIANGENDCALVWVEKQQLGLNSLFSTHYTMLKLDVNGNIINSVPNGMLDSSQPRFASIQYNGNGSAQLNNSSIFKCYYPTIYRPIQYFLRPNYVFDDSVHYASATWDRVYWNLKSYSNSDYVVHHKMLDIDKNLNKWNCLAPFSIFAYQKSLLNPNVMQGTIRPYNNGDSFYDIIGQDSSIILGIASQTGSNNIDTLHSEIWLFPHGFWNLFYYYPGDEWGNPFIEIEPNNFNNAFAINRGKGIYPQLAKSPIVNKTTDWKINSQIFQAVGNDIYVTKQYFYRKNTEDEPMKIHPIMSYVGSDGVDESGISFFELNNFKKPNIKYMGRKNDKYDYLDTIQTEWFRIENIEELSFISQNTKNSTAKILIERRKDGKIFELNQKIFSEAQTTKNRVHLINGKNEQYRILFAKKDTIYQLNFSFMLAKDSELNPNDDLIDADRVGKSSITEFESYVDLNNESYDGDIESGIQINIYPNPADEKIYVSAYLPIEYIKSNNLENNQLTLSIVNSIGGEIYNSEITAGETKAIETNTYSNGIYFVKITKSGTEFTNQTKMFVIKR